MPRKDGVLATVTTVPGPRRPRPLTTRRCGSGTPMTLRICRTRSCLFTDRKSTRLNSSHSQISYAVFCLKKKKHLELPQDSAQMTALAQEVHLLAQRGNSSGVGGHGDRQADQLPAGGPPARLLAGRIHSV